MQILLHKPFIFSCSFELLKTMLKGHQAVTLFPRERPKCAMQGLGTLLRCNLRFDGSGIISVSELGENCSSFIHSCSDVICVLRNRFIPMRTRIFFSSQVPRIFIWSKGSESQYLANYKDLAFLSSTWEHCFRLLLRNASDRDTGNVEELISYQACLLL